MQIQASFISSCKNFNPCSLIVGCLPTTGYLRFSESGVLDLLPEADKNLIELAVSLEGRRSYHMSSAYYGAL